MSVSAVADVQSRISEIQTRFSGRPAAANSGASFQATLSSVLGASSDATTSALGGGLGDPNTSGNTAVAIAQRYLGVPYVWGGTDPKKGLDCSGLVQIVYKEMGVDLPRVAADQARKGTAVASLAEAKPGDLIAFGSPVDHIGIYMGDNKIVHAPRRGEVVKVQEIWKPPSAIRRVLPEGQAFSASSLDLSSLGSVGPSNGTSAISANLRSRFDNLFATAGAKHGISPNLLAAVAKQESGFNPSAASGAGAQGLMQIMPGTAKGLGVNALDPAQAVDGAARMLSGLVKKFGSVELALAGYNAGPGAVQKHGGIPPYKETQQYVRSVMALATQGVGR